MMQTVGEPQARPCLLKGKVLRGCNAHHGSTVFVQRVDLGSLAGRSVLDAGPRFAARLAKRFARLEGPVRGHRDLLQDPNGAESRTFDQALLEAILAVELHVAFTMRRMDAPRFAAVVPDSSSPRIVDLVWECHSGSLSRLAAQVGFTGLLELVPAKVSQWSAEPSQGYATLMRKLRRRSRRRQWSPWTAALALEAKNQGLPYEPYAGAYLRIGEGVLQQVISAGAPKSGPGKAYPQGIAHYFPPGVAARVPTALILGPQGTGTVARELDGLLRASGRAVGLVMRKQTTISGKPVDPTSRGRRGAAAFVLRDPRVEMLVNAVSPRRILARGLGLETVTATAILHPKVGGDAESYRSGVDVGVAATTGGVAIRADHPYLERIRKSVDPGRLVLIAARPTARTTARHLAEGGCAILFTQERIELRQGGEAVASVPVSSLRPGKNGISGRRIRIVMYALALAFGLGLSGSEISAAVERRRFLRR